MVQDNITGQQRSVSAKTFFLSSWDETSVKSTRTVFHPSMFSTPEACETNETIPRAGPSLRILYDPKSTSQTEPNTRPSAGLRDSVSTSQPPAPSERLHVHQHGFSPLLHRSPAVPPAPFMMRTPNSNAVESIPKTERRAQSFIPYTAFPRTPQRAIQPKPGKWGPLHVSIAWRIHHHKQKKRQVKGDWLVLDSTQATGDVIRLPRPIPDPFHGRTNNFKRTAPDWEMWARPLHLLDRLKERMERERHGSYKAEYWGGDQRELCEKPLPVVPLWTPSASLLTSAIGNDLTSFLECGPFGITGVPPLSCPVAEENTYPAPPCRQSWSPHENMDHLGGGYAVSGRQVARMPGAWGNTKDDGFHILIGRTVLRSLTGSRHPSSNQPYPGHYATLRTLCHTNTYPRPYLPEDMVPHQIRHVYNAHRSMFLSQKTHVLP